jgi:hypothetical protein
MVRWFTRDRLANGSFSAWVIEWSARPGLYAYESGSRQWHNEGAYVARHTVAEVKKRLGTAPDDDLQCLRYG